MPKFAQFCTKSGQDSSEISTLLPNFQKMYFGYRCAPKTFFSSVSLKLAALEPFFSKNLGLGVVRTFPLRFFNLPLVHQTPNFCVEELLAMM